MRFQVKPKRKPSIQITSLIDLMFIIIIFLLVTTSFVEQSAIKIDLPHGSQTQKMDQKKILITMGADGKIFLNESEISIKDLSTKLKLEKTKEEDPIVTLRADRKAPYGLAIEVMDQVQTAGFKKVVALTEEEASQSSIREEVQALN